MRVFVTGMHRSGTSALARLLNVMGCYVGEEDELIPPKADNPAGFWEREDARQLNDDILAALGGAWHTGCECSVSSLGSSERRTLGERAAAIVRGLDSHRPWLLKDPRLCRTLGLWRGVVDDAVVVVIHRRPLEVAQSLRTRNGLSLIHGIALWEAYILDLLDNIRGLPRHVVSHRRLMAEPSVVASDLLTWLEGLGFSGLTRPGEETVRGLIRTDLVHARADDDTERPYLSPGRQRLLDALTAGELPDDAGSLTLSADSRDILEGHRQRLRLEEERQQALNERDSLFEEKNELLAELESLSQELSRVGAERDALFKDKNDLLEDQATLVAERHAIWEEKNELLAERDELRLRLIRSEEELDRIGCECAELRSGLETLAREHRGVIEGPAYRLGALLLRPWWAVRRLLARGADPASKADRSS